MLKQRTALLILLFFSVTAFIIYANALNAGFHLDDFVYMHNSPYFKDISRIALLFRKWMRPVSVGSLALNYHFSHSGTVGFHVVNVIIHILASFSVFLLIRLTLSLKSMREKYGSRALLIAFSTALLFLCHPLQTESVTYIVQRMTAMVALFFFLSIYFFGKARTSSKINTRNIYYLLTAITFVLALGCKQNAAMIPFFIILYEFYFFRNTDILKFKKGIIFITICLIFILIFPMFFKGAGYYKFMVKSYDNKDFTLKERLLTEPRVVSKYISLLALPLPSRLNLDYEYPLSSSLTEPIWTLLSILFLVTLLGISFFLIKREPLISFFILWFFGNLAIESTVIPLEIIFEHRTYLPSPGFFIILSILLIKLSEFLKLRIARDSIFCSAVIPVLVVSILFSAGTVARNSVYKDEFTLQEDIVKKAPNNARAWNNLGKAYLEAGNIDEAMKHFLTAIEQNKEYGEAYHNIGFIYKDRGEYDKAETYLLRAIKYKKDFGEAYNTLGIVKAYKKDFTASEKCFKKAIELEPFNANAFKNLGLLYNMTGRKELSIKNYKKALSLDPNVAEAEQLKKIITN